jgi:dynein regulatory complex protein 1
MLRSKTEKQEKLNQQNYLNLTEDYKRITEQFKELQKKFRHFQVSDAKKYREVWKMNEEKATELMRKLMQVLWISQYRLIVSFMSNN